MNLHRFQSSDILPGASCNRLRTTDLNQAFIRQLGMLSWVLNLSGINEHMWPEHTSPVFRYSMAQEGRKYIQFWHNTGLEWIRGQRLQMQF